MKRLFCLFCLLALSIVSVDSVLAIGIGVKPKEVKIESIVNKSTFKEVLIINTSSEPAVFQVYPDGFEDQIEISPKEFRLEANANQIIKVTVKTKDSGRLATNLSIVGRPLDTGGLPAVTGIKLPITIVSSGVASWRIALGLALVICLALIYLIKLRKKKINNN